MAIDFAKTFGDKKAAAANNNAQDKPKAQFWLNIGFTAEGTATEERPEDMFVSLPTGIPLDTMEKLPTNSSNKEFAELQAARNDLMEQMLEFAKQLQPGESKTFTMEVQLRRVKPETEVKADESNKFARKLSFA